MRAHLSPGEASAPKAWNRENGSVMLDVSSMDWAPFPLPGTFFKPLHLADNAGRATFILKIPQGCKADVHKHLAAVEAFVIQGGFSYEGEGSVRAGDYVFEPGGMVHEPAADGEEDLILFVVAHGPVQGGRTDAIKIRMRTGRCAIRWSSSAPAWLV